jgi:ketosteroid isomerase-like protein
MTTASDSKFTVLKRSMWGLLHEIARLPRKPASDVETRLQRLEDELALHDLLTRYTYFYDGNDLDGVMTVFDDHCVLVNPRGTYEGKEAIRENYAHLISTRKFSFHAATNIAIRFLDGGNDAVMSAFYNSIGIYPSGSLAMVGGTYVDRLAKKAGEWKIVERRITYNHRSRLAAENPFDAPKPFPKGTVSESSRDWIGRDAQM